MASTTKQPTSPAVAEQDDDEEEIVPPGEEHIESEDAPTGGDQSGEQQENGQPGWVDLLQAETPADEIHQRAALTKSGQVVMKNGQPMMLDFVTARFVQDRLDAALGPLNWQTHFESLADGSVRCGIGIRAPGSDEWVWKWDVGVPSNIEPQKGAHSDAFKRAGVQWGIARDLYDARDEDPQVSVEPSIPAKPAAPGQPIHAQMQQQVQPGAYVEEAQQPRQQQVLGQGAPAWVCPIHDDSKVVPAGVSKRTGNPYPAFYACPVAGCDQKGPRA